MIFKKDSFLLGTGIGIAIPAILFGFMALLKVITGHVMLDKAAFICIALNIVPIRYFFISAGHENTGKGVLFITVILIITVTLVNFNVIPKLFHG